MNAPTARAWVLEAAPSRWVAFAAQSALSLVEAPDCLHVPGAPGHCLGLMQWQGRTMAFVDVAAYADGEGARATPSDHALVVAWTSPAHPGQQLGAIAAPALARLIEVSDSQQCEPPADAGALRGLALAWFQYEDRPVAVVDAARLFA